MATKLKVLHTILKVLHTIMVDFRQISKEMDRAAKAINGINQTIQERKARNRRIYFRLVFYFLMILATVMVIMFQMHIIAKIVLVFVIASTCFFVREADRAPVIDPRIPMSPEEEIIQKEMEG